MTRRSYRRFANEPISSASFAAALAALRQIQIDGRPKYLYGSAGGLYPVQSYLYVKPNRVAGFQGGHYYYDAVAHRAVLLSDETSLDADLFDPFINGPVFEQSAFGLFLIADIKAIAPMYRERSLHFAAIEAGMMAQLLEMTGPEHGIGYCQIGTMNFDPLRQPFQLEESHVPVHALMGGSIESATPENWSPFQEGHSNVYKLADDREEGVL